MWSWLASDAPRGRRSISQALQPVDKHQHPIAPAHEANPQ
jgi:hypothetical protein